MVDLTDGREGFDFLGCHLHKRMSGPIWARSRRRVYYLHRWPSRTIKVSVIDDAHDEGEETLTLTLSGASGGLLTDGEATGTIENRDPLPRGLLARFGRTAAVHVVEHVEERLQAPREPGFRGRFAGRELRRGWSATWPSTSCASSGARPACIRPGWPGTERWPARRRWARRRWGRRGAAEAVR